MKKLFINIYPLFLLLLSSCSIYKPNIDSNFNFLENSNSGIVFGSLTQDNILNTFDKEYVDYSILKKNGPLIKISSREQIPLLPYFKFGDFYSIKGRLFILALPEGEYSLYSWGIMQGDNYIKPGNRPNEIPFTVNKGKITYIGNMHMVFHTNNFLYLIDLVETGTPILLDNHERDTKKLKLKYPNIISQFPYNAISNQVAFIGPWSLDNDKFNLKDLEKIKQGLMNAY